MSGRSVRLFLVDDAPQGMRTAEVGQWSGLALVCPRTDLAKYGTGIKISGHHQHMRMGMRVRAQWRLPAELGANIDHFRPSGEPDAPFESYANHL